MFVYANSRETPLTSIPRLSRSEPAWQGATAVGTVVSGVVGYVVIGWLLGWLRTRTTHLFVAWRIALGLLVAVLLWQGVLPADDAPEPPRGAAATRAR